MNFSMTATINELRAGICELTLLDEFSVEKESIMGTLSKYHMADFGDEKRAEDIANNFNESGSMVELWDVHKEMWQKIAVREIVEIERLTGKGIGKKTSEVCPDDLNDEYELINIPEEEEKKLASKEDSDNMTDCKQEEETRVQSK